jgi:hypothetical protein
MGSREPFDYDRIRRPEAVFSTSTRTEAGKVAGEAAVVGKLTEAGGDRRRGAVAAEESRLAHFPQVLRRGRLSSAGNGR